MKDVRVEVWSGQLPVELFGLREVVVAVGLEHDFAEVFPLQVVVVSLLLNHFLMAF